MSRIVPLRKTSNKLQDLGLIVTDHYHYVSITLQKRKQSNKSLTRSPVVPIHNLPSSISSPLPTPRKQVNNTHDRPLELPTLIQPPYRARNTTITLRTLHQVPDLSHTHILDNRPQLIRCWRLFCNIELKLRPLALLPSLLLVLCGVVGGLIFRCGGGGGCGGLFEEVEGTGRGGRGGSVEEGYDVEGLVLRKMLVGLARGRWRICTKRNMLWWTGRSMFWLVV